MQGQRGKMVSLPETFEIDRASSSSSATVDQQLCWNDLRSPPETCLPGYVLPPNDNFTFVNSNIHEQQNMNSWNRGESSSSSAAYRSTNSEWKIESGWPSDICSRQGPSLRIEDQLCGPNNNVFSLDMVNMNPLFLQGSGSSSPALNINSNPDIVTSGGSGGCIREENGVRQGGSADNRRIPCKRKSHEGHVGESSIGETSDLHPVDTSVWHTHNAAACFNFTGSGSLAMAPISEQADPRLGLGLIGSASQSTPSSSAEVSQRNFRLRFTNSSRSNSMRPQPLVSTVHPPGSQPSRLVSANHSFESPLPSALNDASAAHCQPPIFHVANPPQPGPSVRWTRSLVPRAGNSSPIVNIDPIAHDEAGSSNIARNGVENPLFVPPELRTLAQSSGFLRNVATASRSGSSSATPQLSHHNSMHHQSHHARYPRRMLEYVRRQGMPSAYSGGQSSQSPHRLGHPAFTQDMAVPSGPSIPGHRQPFSRSGLRMERQADGVVGVPYPMRALATASEGRRRLASEIRSVLDMVRRGEALRFEDVMILDPSVIFGVPDIRDRHRDMRLDVDNMSYEELLALEERIGNVSTGLNEETILARMKQRKYTKVVNVQVEAEPCCICQEDYNGGEAIGTLECGHDFHRDCIKQWLTHKNLCPICKTAGLTI